MIHDRALTISIAGTSKSMTWLPERITWAGFTARLQTPVHGAETLDQYLRMTKPEQDKRKDVGGYVGGTLRGERRRKADVTGRDLITLDLDALPSDGVALVVAKLDALGCAWAIYSTRKHQPNKPRLRIILPLQDTITGEEYEPVARKLTEQIGLLWCDPTTFQAERMMYWPSVCLDAEYVFQTRDKPLLDAKHVLATYQDWRDVRSWPTVPGTTDAPRVSGVKKPDPTEKEGPIGAFCRQYSIPDAMEEFLPGVYVPVEGDPHRYTFTGGSTTGGAIVYDDGHYLCSHHATDPVGDRGVNAFDLVRVHLYGKDDERVAPETPVNRLPSYSKMILFAMSLPEVQRAVYREQEERTRQDFAPAPDDKKDEKDDLSWFAELARDNHGRIMEYPRNVLAMLERDPELKGRVYMNSFSGQFLGRSPLPWPSRRGEEKEFIWGDFDTSGLRGYITTRTSNQIRGVGVIEDGYKMCVAAHAINPVRDYLQDMPWDGVQRLDRALIDYLGADDSSYTRAVTRVMFVAAVYRVMADHSVKYDTMCVLTGNQGIGKSTFIRKMAIMDLYTDGITDFEGKNAAEIIQGKVFIEVPEMHAMYKSDINRVKSFLSQEADDFRPAYGRMVEHRPRRCVFWGTSNDYEYLSDPTGGRRFFPIDTKMQKPMKNIWKDLDGEKKMIWAEAYAYWTVGAPTILIGDDAIEAIRQQDMHTTQDTRDGVIRAFLEQKVPAGWLEMDLSARKMWKAGGGRLLGENDAVSQRDRVCAQEVFQECLGGDLRFMKNADAREINRIIRTTGEWMEAPAGTPFGYCGRGRGFFRSTNP